MIYGVVSSVLFCLLTSYIVFGVHKNLRKKIKSLEIENAEMRQDLVKYQVYEKNKELLASWLSAHHALEDAGKCTLTIQKINPEDTFIWQKV